MWFPRLRRKSILGRVLSQKALEDAEHNLSEVKKRSREVSQISNALKDIRERNHFAEQLEAIIVRPRGPLRHDT